MDATHVVTRPFTEVEPLKVGDKVNARDWPNRPFLEDQGYMRAMTPTELDKKK